MWPFDPVGYELVRQDGTTHNKIRFDQIPRGMLVIIEDGRRFVRTSERDGDFVIFREGQSTFVYQGSGE